MTTLRPGGLILGYHRIADGSWDPLGLCVHPAHFRQHLEVLLDLCTPVSLQTLVTRLREKRHVTGMVALTFDDGYRDFFENARPELDRLGVPATVFIATGFIGRSYWWDEVACFLRPGRRTSNELALRWNEPGSTRVYSNLTSERGAERAAQDLCRDLSMCDAAVRADIMQQLRQLGRTASDTSTQSGTMSEHELRELARFPNMEIGSHTVNHPMLAQLGPSEQCREIESSRRCLEVIVGTRGVQGFSYPNGSFSARTRQLVAAKGYEYACASQPEVARHGQDLYSLPRLWAPNADHRRFRTWLSSWRGIRIETSSSRNSKHESAR
jgi:peptidoglycan/xylan/chitin deacetylase (PgdA/CDA1 family)